MGEFFKGWRRKAGLVTLTIACVLMVGWVRSMVVGDQLFLESLNGWIVSDDQAIHLELLTSDENGKGYVEVSWPVPYWWFVLPLTLLSAWLILGKPRKGEVAAVQPGSSESSRLDRIIHGLLMEE